MENDNKCVVARAAPNLPHLPSLPRFYNIGTSPSLFFADSYDVCTRSHHTAAPILTACKLHDILILQGGVDGGCGSPCRNASARSRGDEE